MNKTIKDMALSTYEPNFRFIDTMNVQYPTSTGTFQIPKKQYTTFDARGLSGACQIILLTQATFIALGDNILNNCIPELDYLNIKTLDDARNFMNNMLVTGYNDIVFKKVIAKNEPNKTFTFTVDKVRKRPSKGLIFFDVSCSISDDKTTGRGRAVYCDHKMSLLTS